MFNDDKIQELQERVYNLECQLRDIRNVLVSANIVELIDADRYPRVILAKKVN